MEPVLPVVVAVSDVPVPSLQMALLPLTLGVPALGAFTVTCTVLVTEVVQLPCTAVATTV